MRGLRYPSIAPTDLYRLPHVSGSPDLGYYGDFAPRRTGLLNVSSTARTGLDAGHHRRDRDGSGAGCDSLDW